MWNRSKMLSWPALFLLPFVAHSDDYVLPFLAPNPFYQFIEPPICTSIENSEYVVPPLDKHWDQANMEKFISNPVTPFSAYVNIIRRKEWKAKDPKKPLVVLENPKMIVIHHTALPRDEGSLAIQELHMSRNKWDDIGYHYLIAIGKDGHWHIFQGRSPISETCVDPPDEKTSEAGCRAVLAQGAHVGNANDQAIGIAIAGNYEPSNPEWNPDGYLPLAPDWQSQPPAEAVLLLGQLITKLKNDYPTIMQIREHALTLNAADLESDKACPGTGMLPMINAIRKRFEFNWQTDPVTTSVTPPLTPSDQTTEM